ncbi:MAG: hypothetical protein CVT88_03375 [Candidatus Altiarchaeales archaeon HGW-Altiarchaeales-1]|nr:MAG: hypothetical protein CVT88_03375 [Candidatus Altiarchaeales archaeon HGW-Altiarchaeales-1]
MAKKELYEKGLEKYPLPIVVFTNLLLSVWFGSAAYGMSALSAVGIPIVSVAYLLFAAAMLGFVLRKHLCTNCYYYGKTCGTGWGKWSACLFKKDSSNSELGQKLAGATWGMLTVIPLVGIPAAIYLNPEFQINGVIAFVVFLLTFVISMLGRKKGCAQCKMRYICGGSAAKK